MKFSTRDYKIAIFFLFLGFIASCVLFFKINAHEIWYWKTISDIGGLRLEIVKLEGTIEGYNKLTKGLAEYMETYDAVFKEIFKKPIQPIKVETEIK